MPKVHKNYSSASVYLVVEVIKSEYYELVKHV